MANPGIGVKGWRNYSTFALFAGGSQRADRQTSLLVDTLSGNLSVLATDWVLAGRIPCALARSYNHQDTTAGVDRPFGPGWYWQFDMNLTGGLNGSGTVTWKAADGSEYDFTSPTGTSTEKTYTSPAGLHDYLLTWLDGSPDSFTLAVGRMVYSFTVHAGNSRARLMSILDLNGNGLVVDRAMSGSDPTNVINYIKIRYDNSGTPALHNIVQPSYTGTLISKLRLTDTLGSGDYLDLVYNYSPAPIDGATRLIRVEPQFGGVSLDMEVEYGYNPGTGLGLQMTSIADTLGVQGSYAWAIAYAGSPAKVSSVTFPIDNTPTTGAVSYDYAPGAPSGWSHGSPSAWTKVEDARGNDWYYGLNADGTVQFALDPLWVDSTHESYTEYGYNGDLQVASVGTARPNGEGGRLTTSYYYNDKKKLAAVVDAYGFVSWYKYGARAAYDGGGTGATTNDVIGVFTVRPNTQAYDDSDHTLSETSPPALSSPLDVDSFVDWNNNVANAWGYLDGNSDPVALVRSVMDYEYGSGTGRLEKLRSCSPANFDESSATSYALTTASGATEQRFDAATGDLEESYTPRQFQSGSIGHTEYAYDALYGTITTVEGADSEDAGANKWTTYSYNSTHTRVTKVAQPQDNTDQWTETIYDHRLFALQIRRPDIQGWGVDPVVSVTVYDDNGNIEEQWQADPAATSTLWDGDTGGGGYSLVGTLAYDRLSRLVESIQYVDWQQTGISVQTPTSKYFYDANGNRIRTRGPAYDVGGTDHYDYSFVEYDAANRVHKAYNAAASTNASLAIPPFATPFTQYAYDLLGNAVTIYEPLYDWLGEPPLYYYFSETAYDWLSRSILTTANYDASGTPTARTTRQHFSASGGVYWSQDGEGFRMWPVADRDGRLLRMYRDNPSTGDYDERSYDADGRVLYAYSYQDIADGNYRTRNKYDNMGRLVNSGREEEVATVWVGWNSNTADTTFDWNGAVLRTYDKVNTGKYTERVYDDWGQLITLKAPEVPDPSGVGTIVYEQAFTYDVLGRRLTAEDHESNTTTFYYDVLGRTIKVKDTGGFITQYWYDARGYQWKTLTPRGAEYLNTYDARGLRVQQDVDHDSTVDTTTWQYDPNGRLIEAGYPDGGETLWQYDALGRKINSLSKLIGGYLTTLYEHDLNNRLVKLTQPGGYEQEYIFDALGNLEQSSDAAGDDTFYSYDLENRRLTATQPSGLVVTNIYDWKTGGIRWVSSGAVITQYAFDANGQTTGITDGNSQVWTKAYDAMGRMVSLTTPDPGAGAFTQTLTLDGNGNISRTEDFNGTPHYYRYDLLNRMLGHGSTNTADDEEYAWNCCNSLSGYTDGFGTAVLAYDDLGRLLSHTDSAGSQVQYEYDALGRVVALLPPRGEDYRAEYAYNLNGSLAAVTVYDAGTPAVTDYGYDGTSGQLLTRDFPEAASNRIRTAYAYDGAGRLEWETVTRESGGSTNLYRTQYGYDWLTPGREVVRTEQEWTGSAWANSARVTYRSNAQGWQSYEQREEWTGSAWGSRYAVGQNYDLNGNRVQYAKAVETGYTGTYGRSAHLRYYYDTVNRPYEILDGNDAGYLAALTCDANGSILEIEESVTAGGNTGYIYTHFDVDDLNRVTSNRLKYFDGSDWRWTKREHAYSATGAILQSTYKAWEDGDPEPPGTALLHSWGQDGRHIQNTDGSTGFGEVWHWAGAAHAHGGPLKSPAADTASEYAYNAGAGGGAGTPVCRSFIDPTTESDERNLWAQGMPNGKGATNAWATGSATQDNSSNIDPGVESRFAFAGTVATDLDRATDPREKGRVGFFGSGYSYDGSSPRVTSETIGRDINPLGRGNGMALVGGMLNLGRISPSFPLSQASRPQGSSVNNNCPGCPPVTGGTEGGGGSWGSGSCCGCGWVTCDAPGTQIMLESCRDKWNAYYDCNNGSRPCWECQDKLCGALRCEKDCMIEQCPGIGFKQQVLEDCGCGGGEGSVGGGAGTIPGGGQGGCPTCPGGGSTPPSTGDIFGAHFGPAGAGGGGLMGFSGQAYWPGGVWNRWGPLSSGLVKSPTNGMSFGEFDYFDNGWSRGRGYFTNFLQGLGIALAVYLALKAQQKYETGNIGCCTCDAKITEAEQSVLNKCMGNCDKGLLPDMRDVVDSTDIPGIWREPPAESPFNAFACYSQCCLISQSRLMNQCGISAYSDICYCLSGCNNRGVCTKGWTEVNYQQHNIEDAWIKMYIRNRETPPSVPPKNVW